MNPRTSISHPLEINSINLAGGGRIGMTFSPGKKDLHAQSGPWDRDLKADLATVKDWGADLLVTLVEAHELDLLGVPDLGRQVLNAGMAWLHLPIVDVSIPNREFETNWPTVKTDIVDALLHGRGVVLHCRGGLGRTGLVAAWLLIETGIAPADAISVVRRARPGTIETREQEQYVLARRQLEFSGL